ncbi:MAG TPA: helix-turn-helix domain-containing protein, partial [Pelobium sp.]|nr:helix-turn-helix domain-containing protein [Pelobium sp.]
SNKLNELSKRFLGNTANEIIKQRIFMEAKVLLTHTEKSVKEIAMELNFSDASHFNKFFASNSKITPGEYRKLLKT